MAIDITANAQLQGQSAKDTQLVRNIPTVSVMADNVGNQTMRDATNQTAAVVIVVFLFLAIGIVTTVYCIFKQKRRQEKKAKNPTSDQVEETLINGLECSENFAEPDLGIIVGPRDRFTKNPVNKDWFDVNLIPYMDNSVENLTDI